MAAVLCEFRLKCLATGVSLLCWMSARCSLNRVRKFRFVSPIYCFLRVHSRIDDIVGLTIYVFCEFVLPVVLRQFVSSFDKFASLAVLLFAILLGVGCCLGGVRF